MIRGEFVVDNAVLLVRLSTEAAPDEIAILVMDQFALIIACPHLHFGDPHHEMNPGRTAPVIFRVAGAGTRHRHRCGKAEGECDRLHRSSRVSARTQWALGICYAAPFL